MDGKKCPMSNKKVKGFEAEDTLTPIPVSGDREKDLAIAKHNAGVTRSQDRRAKDATTAAEIIKLHKAGRTVKQIAVITGIEPSVIKQVINVQYTPAKDTSPVFNLSPVPMPEDEHGQGRYARAWGEDAEEKPLKNCKRCKGTGTIQFGQGSQSLLQCPACHGTSKEDWKEAERQWTAAKSKDALTPIPMEDEHGQGRYAQAWGEDGDVNVGDKVHLGFGTKGGAGFEGTVTKVEGDTVFIKNTEGRTFKGPLRLVSKSGATDALTPIPMEDAEVTTKRQPNPNPNPRSITSLALPTPVDVSNAYQPRSATELKKSFGKDELKPIPITKAANVAPMVRTVPRSKRPATDTTGRCPEGDDLLYKAGKLERKKDFTGAAELYKQAGKLYMTEGCTTDALWARELYNIARIDAKGGVRGLPPIGKAKDGPWDDNVARLTENIKKEVRAQKADGTVSMSKANLKQMVKSGGLRFPNENAFERAFEEALVKAGVGKFVHATDALRGLTPVGV
jgi:hypothetical protein